MLGQTFDDENRSSLTEFFEGWNTIQVVVVLSEGCECVADTLSGYCRYWRYRRVHFCDDVLELVIC